MTEEVNEKAHAMRFGLFCTYENPHSNLASAYTEQIDLVRMIEALGFQEAWVAEHHFNAGATSSSAMSILAYLAAQTSRIRLGSAATLLAFRDPILVAEDIATVDILSGGRFNLGVGKGGAFPSQNHTFRISPTQARQKMWEALQLIQKLLYENAVSFDGTFFKTDQVELVPKATQRRIPTFIATSAPDLIAMAAEQGYGLMAGPPFPLARVRDYLSHYRETAPERDPSLVLIRFYHLAETREQALRDARVLLGAFVERMRITTAKMQPDWLSWMEIDRLIADSLIGSESDVRAKIAEIGEHIAPGSLILKPISPDFAKRKRDLQAFAEFLMLKQ